MATRLAAGGDQTFVVLPGADGRPILDIRGNTFISFSDPTVGTVPADGGVGTISAGLSHSLLLTNDGQVLGAGRDDFGQIGARTNLGNTNPNSFGVLGTAVTVAAGGWHSLLLQRDGTVLALGRNTSGQLGTVDGNLTDATHPAPTPVPGLTDISAIAAGIGHSVAVRRDGTVWTWGSNAFGELGRATNNGLNAANPAATASSARSTSPSTRMSVATQRGASRR